VRTFSARGPFLQDDHNDTLSRVVRQTRLAGGDADATIAANITTFGPNQREAARAKVAQIRLQGSRSEPQLGSFAGVAAPPDTRYAFVWEIRAQDDGQRTYLLTVEPFSGRLISAREQQ
jgi:hypothetical protein